MAQRSSSHPNLEYQPRNLDVVLDLFILGPIWGWLQWLLEVIFLPPTGKQGLAAWSLFAFTSEAQICKLQMQHQWIVGCDSAPAPSFFVSQSRTTQGAKTQNQLEFEDFSATVHRPWSLPLIPRDVAAADGAGGCDACYPGPRLSARALRKIGHGWFHRPLSGNRRWNGLMFMSGKSTKLANSHLVRLVRKWVCLNRDDDDQP
jgi:hypothetical protein